MIFLIFDETFRHEFASNYQLAQKLKTKKKIMARKVNKKVLILIGLILVNLVGYISASYYFADSDTPKLFSLDFLHSAAHSSTRILNTERILSIGLELFRNIGG